MKLIHCADLHLDSPMESNLPVEKAKERKGEILATFAKLVRIAEEGGVSAILIAGDLFDREQVSKKTEEYVMELIASHPNLYFFYLAGNHDKGNALREGKDRPKNLCTFEEGWRSYSFGDVVITGSESPNPDTLKLDGDKLNVVLMHGQERAGNGAMEADVIRFAALKDKNIDYLALGHLHEYREAKIDRRCTACYSGCLEGRGFDECGQKGYVLLEIEGGKLTHRFVPMARRSLHTVPCDVSGFSTKLELENRVLEAVKEIPAGDLVKLVLTGEISVESPKDLRALRSLLSERFYFAKLRDDTKYRLEAKDYENDISLRGEFVRRVLASGLKEEEKKKVIACGLCALSGEEVEL